MNIFTREKQLVKNIKIIYEKNSIKKPKEREREKKNVYIEKDTATGMANKIKTKYAITRNVIFVGASCAMTHGIAV